MMKFEEQIKAFNKMYALPVAASPELKTVVIDEVKKDMAIDSFKRAVLTRLAGFIKTISDEVNEGHDISAGYGTKVAHKKGKPVEPTVYYSDLDLLVDMADWLGDIIVYCASEMTKFGLPVEETLSIIMSSNFSKMGADGKPMYDANGKVLKGPGYWKPEPQIRQMLLEKLEQKADIAQPDGIVWR